MREIIMRTMIAVVLCCMMLRTCAAQQTASTGVTGKVNPLELVISPSTLTAATIGMPYSFSFAATGGIAPYSWSVPAGCGSLPTGLTLSSSGVLSGTPTAPGSFSFTIAATDSDSSPSPYPATSSKPACQTAKLNDGGPSFTLVVARR